MHDSVVHARTFWELLSARAAVTPDLPMLLDSSGRSLSFGEVHRWSERVAAGFYEQGVREGTPVTWQLPTRIETVVISFALARLGAVQNPIIHIYRDKELGFCIRQTKAQLVLTAGTWKGFDYTAMAQRVCDGMESRPVIREAYSDLPESDPVILPDFIPTAASTVAGSPSGDGPVRWVYYTSGTTSDPKGAQHTDQTLIAGGYGLSIALSMSESDIGSIAFPYAHIGGPNYIVTMLLSGFPAVLMESFVPTEAIPTYASLGVTMAGGGPAFYSMVLAEQRKDPSRKVIPTLRLLSGGGAPMPEALFYEVRSEVGVPISHGYGMTECPMISQGSPSDSDAQLATSEGHPVRGCTVSIFRQDGTLAGPGEVGEVRVSGPMLFKGYLDAALNEEAFDENGRFRTGDLGMLREDGHVRLTGRSKDVIIRKGENISAQEIEGVLYAHEKVSAVAVIGLPDADRGELVCAVVEPIPAGDPLTFAEMQAWCRSAGLMTQKIPERLELRSVLPRNATLKILKHQLRDELIGLSQSPANEGLAK